MKSDPFINLLNGNEVKEFPNMLWAKFTGVGKMPKAIQELNRKIFSEWLPNHTEYEQATADINLEWYSAGKIDDENYVFGVWIPVRKRANPASAPQK